MNNHIRLLILVPLLAILVYAEPSRLASQPSTVNGTQKRSTKTAKGESAQEKNAQSKEAEWSPLTECKSEQAQTTDTPTFRVGANSKGVAAASTRVYKDGLIIPDDNDLKSPEVQGLREQLSREREKRKQAVEEAWRVFKRDIDLPYFSENKRIVRIEQAYSQFHDLQNSASWAQLTKCDWRERGLDVGQVMNQGKCGSCWAFAATSVYLSSWKLDQLRLGKAFFETYYLGGDYSYQRVPSVQQLLNCISKSKGDCRSGWHGTAFDFMVTSHVPHIPDRLVWNKGDKARVEEYTARKSPCATVFRAGEVDRGGYDVVPLEGPDSRPRLPRSSDKIQTTINRALMWGYVNEKNPNDLPTVEQLKAALVEHGPLAVAINADNCFTVYKGGVFNGHNKYSPNHVLMLIGWDDSKADNKGAWLIKNSWGVEWGEAGFGWVEYGSNSIGRFAAWIQPSPSTRER